MRETYDAVTKLDAIEAQWPDGRDVPPMIGQVAQYLRDKPWGSVGEIRWFDDRMNDWWIEQGADLADQFGVFMRLPEGSMIALWFHDGCEPGREPVVYVGSEGESYLCGESLAGFFESIATLRRGEKLPAEFQAEEEDDGDEEGEGDEEEDEDDDDASPPPDERPALLAFLRSLPGWRPTEPTTASWSTR